MHVVGKQGLVEHGHQRSALSSRCHVASSEIRHHRNSKFFGQYPGIANLKGQPLLRDVPYRMTMKPQDGNPRLHLGMFFQQLAERDMMLRDLVL